MEEVEEDGGPGGGVGDGCGRAVADLERGNGERMAQRATVEPRARGRAAM